LTVPENLEDPLHKDERHSGHKDDAKGLRRLVREGKSDEEGVAHREDAPRDHLQKELKLATQCVT